MNRQECKKSSDWLQQVARWFEACESELPEPGFLQGEFPDWVQRLLRELIATFCPVAKLKVGPEWTAGEVGALVGHRLAYCYVVAEMPTMDGAPAQTANFTKSQVVVVQRSLALAAAQSYPDAKQFFTAFAKALNKKPADAEASNFERTSTKVYAALLQIWPSVGTMRSVRELRQALCRHLDADVVGDVKRVEKMCQRLGLRFGRPGRPKKAIIAGGRSQNAQRKRAISRLPEQLARARLCSG